MNIFKHGLDHAARSGLHKLGIKSKTVDRGVKWLLNPTRAMTKSHRGSAFRSVFTPVLGTIESGKLMKQYNKAVAKVVNKTMTKQNSASSAATYQKAQPLNYRLDTKYRRLSDITPKSR